MKNFLPVWSIFFSRYFFFQGRKAADHAEKSISAEKREQTKLSNQKINMGRQGLLIDQQPYIL